jgi:hypothetical protein
MSVVRLIYATSDDEVNQLEQNKMWESALRCR